MIQFCILVGLELFVVTNFAVFDYSKGIFKECQHRGCFEIIESTYLKKEL